MVTLSIIIVDFGEEQWLDIAQAMHTIEMIPKSMILIISNNSASYYNMFSLSVNSNRN